MSYTMQGVIPEDKIPEVFELYKEGYTQSRIVREGVALLIEKKRIERASA